jgi:hypothetical protein
VIKPVRVVAPARHLRPQVVPALASYVGRALAIASLVAAPIAGLPTPDPQMSFSYIAAAPAPFVEPVTVVAEVPLDELLRKATKRNSSKVAVIKRMPSSI